MKGWGNNGLVKKYVNWSLEEKVNSFITPASIFSLKICQSISKCLVFLWNTGFSAVYKALWLSQYNTGVFLHSIFKSLNKYRFHWSSHVVAAKAQYASLDDLETINCLLFLREMRYLQRKKNWPEIYIQVSQHEA